ncbi:hypothetical protein BJX99DRAFT_250105 [Aspergillus californicus]
MFFALRGLNKVTIGRKIAHLSMLCRGKAITRDELFSYTNGRFLADEKDQLERRYVNFDLEALCETAAAAGDGASSQIMSVEKFEGGFSKAFLMKKENGVEVIAKIPCRIAGPALLTTGAEVGALNYDFSWSSDSSNPVGSEYIIMEKAAGVPLYQQWGEMTELEKLRLIKDLTKLEAQLSSVSFPAYGALYRQSDADGRFEHVQLGEGIDSLKQFCVGRSAIGRFYWTLAPHARLIKGLVRNTISEVGIAIAKRELSRMSCKLSTRPLPFYHGTTEEKTQLLKMTLDFMPLLDSHPTLIQASQPRLSHTDLHMGNIFVRPDNKSEIACFIDFQSLLVLPAFLQAQWPLPDDSEDMDDDDKTLARQEWIQTKLAKAYEVSSYLQNRPGHSALMIPRVFRELFTRCGEITEMGIFESWSGLGFSGQCPFSFTMEEREVHERQFADYKVWHDLQQQVLECLDTDAEEWVDPRLNFGDVKKRNQELLKTYIEQAKGQKTEAEARAMWPFPVL